MNKTRMNSHVRPGVRLTLACSIAALGTATACALAAAVVPAPHFIPVAWADDAPLTITAPVRADLGTSQPVTFSLPNINTGSVAVYLDGVPQGEPVPVTSGFASARIVVPSYGEHTITARYLDGKGESPYKDVTATFDTPLPSLATNDKAADAGEEYKGEVNNAEYSVEDPLIVEPGETLTYTFTVKDWGRFFEAGFNAPAGFNYIEGSARRIGTDKTAVTTRGTESGNVSFNPPNSTYKDPQWGQDGAPAVTSSYIGIQPTDSYNLGNAFSHPTVSFEASYTVPADALPGLYIAGFAQYKYSAGLKQVAPFTTTAVRVENRALPPRTLPGGKLENNDPGTPRQIISKSNLGATCQTTGAPAGQDSQMAITTRMETEAPNFVFPGDEFKVRLTSLPMELPGRQSIATLNHVDRLKVDFKLPDPKVFEIVSFEQTAPGTYLGGVPADLTRINAKGEPDPNGEYMRLSGNNITATNGPKAAIAEGGLRVNIGGKTIDFTVPEYVFTLRAVGKPGDVGYLTIRNDAESLKYNKDTNFITMVINLSIFGSQRNLAVRCQPNAAAAERKVFQVKIMDPSKPIEADDLPPEITDDPEPPANDEDLSFWAHIGQFFTSLISGSAANGSGSSGGILWPLIALITVFGGGFLASEIASGRVQIPRLELVYPNQG